MGFSNMINIKKFVLISFLTLTSCGDSNEYITVGLDLEEGSQVFTSRVQVGFKAKRTQDVSNFEFEVFVGHESTFSAFWEDYYLNPGYGYFGITTRIIDTHEDSTLKEYYHILEDFPNSEKYNINFETSEGLFDYANPLFKESFISTFDFSEFFIDSRTTVQIDMFFSYFDDEGNKISSTEIFNGFGGNGMSTSMVYLEYKDGLGTLS